MVTFCFSSLVHDFHRFSFLTVSVHLFFFFNLKREDLLFVYNFKSYFCLFLFLIIWWKSKITKSDFGHLGPSVEPKLPLWLFQVILDVFLKEQTEAVNPNHRFVLNVYFIVNKGQGHIQQSDLFYVKLKEWSDANDGFKFKGLSGPTHLI